MLNVDIDKPKLISIHELNRKTSPYVYVLNTSESELNGVIKKGAVSMPLKTPSGNVMLKVPNTWIPIDLSLSAPKNLIVDDLTFRKCLNNNIIALVDEEWAQAVLKTEDAKLEANRLIKHHTLSSTNLQRIDEAVLTPEESINPLVVEMLSGSEEEETKLDEPTLYAQLLNNANSLNEKDWQYVIENVTSEKIKELALKKLNK